MLGVSTTKVLAADCLVLTCQVSRQSSQQLNRFAITIADYRGYI
nr:MAG TPA: hypothetical protein [Caudoviricetes sp.]